MFLMLKTLIQKVAQTYMPKKLQFSTKNSHAEFKTLQILYEGSEKNG